MIRHLIRATRSVQQAIAASVGKLQLRYHGVRYGPRLTLLGRPIVARGPGSRIEIGSDVVLCSTSRHAGLGVNHPVVLRAGRAGAEIVIGDRVGMSGGTFLALRSITIGAGSLLGANVTVVDSDFHPLDPARRHEPLTSDAIAIAPVRIGENVFIGTSSIILKGVTIGANSVIGAGSVVTKDIPANVIAGGNPCRVLKQLTSDQRGSSSAPRRVAIAALSHDVLNPSTWSGTPANLAGALRRRGIEVIGINGQLGSVVSFACRVASKLFRSPGEYYRKTFFRTLNSRAVRRAIEASGVDAVLHMGTLAVPVNGVGPGVRQYMLADATWDTYAPLSRGTGENHVACDADRIERCAYAQMAHLFPISQYVGENLAEHYGVPRDRITVVGTGRGKIATLTGPKPQTNIILFVAKIRFEEKGGPLLLEAFQIARRKRPELELVMVAPPEHRALAAGIENLRFLSNIPWDDLQRLFEQAALFAMPALYEPWGLVFWEALACKTPVLGLERNALPEITGSGKYGFLVSDPTPQAVADAICRAFSDRARLLEMGEAGQRYCIERCSWDRVAAEIARVIFPEEGP